jgi:hypothetical protein
VFSAVAWRGVLGAGRALLSAAAIALALAAPLATATAQTDGPAQAGGAGPPDALPIKNRHIDISREGSTERPRSEGDQAIVNGWPLYRTERGQEAFNDAMATLRATDGAAPAPKAFKGCAGLECNLSLPTVGEDGWIPAGRIWVSPTEYVLFVRSPRLREGQSYRRRSYRDMRYFVFHEFHNSTRNTDPYDTISSHSGSVFVPLYMSKAWTDAKGRRFVIVLQVAPYDVVSIHASNRGSAGPGMEVAKNYTDPLEPLQATAGVLVATIIKAAAPHLEVVNHAGTEGQPMLTAYENRLAALRARVRAPLVALPFVPAPAQRVATAIGRLDDLIAPRDGSSPVAIAERAIVPPRAATISASAVLATQPPAAAPALSPLATYLRANLAAMKRLPDFARVIPQDVDAVAEDSPEAGVVYLLDASQQVLGRIEAHQQQATAGAGTYVYVALGRAVEDSRSFELDLSRPVSVRSASLSSRPAGSLTPTLVAPIRPATKPLPSPEPALVAPLRPATRPAALSGGAVR